MCFKQLLSASLNEEMALWETWHWAIPLWIWRIDSFFVMEKLIKDPWVLGHLLQTIQWQSYFRICFPRQNLLWAFRSLKSWGLAFQNFFHVRWQCLRSLTSDVAGLWSRWGWNGHGMNCKWSPGQSRICEDKMKLRAKKNLHLLYICEVKHCRMFSSSKYVVNLAWGWCQKDNAQLEGMQ